MLFEKYFGLLRIYQTNEPIQQGKSGWHIIINYFTATIQNGCMHDKPAMLDINHVWCIGCLKGILFLLLL